MLLYNDKTHLSGIQKTYIHWLLSYPFLYNNLRRYSKKWSHPFCTTGIKNSFLFSLLWGNSSQEFCFSKSCLCKIIILFELLESNFQSCNQIAGNEAAFIISICNTLFNVSVHVYKVIWFEVITTEILLKKHGLDVEMGYTYVQEDVLTVS